MRHISVSRSRRRGQALLLAVLIMIFAALISASFIAIVAVNLNQTARQQDKQAAVVSATAGINALNTQLISSKEGENWRPEMVASPPAPGDPTYEFYWTALDKAQGWARTVPVASTSDTMPSGWATSVSGDWDSNNVFEAQKDDWAKLEYFKRNDPSIRVFVKSPDPRNPIPDDAPRYAAEVAFLNSTNTIGTADTDKMGMLRLTVIGLSGNDLRAYDRRVAYKPTSLNGSPPSFVRYDANYSVQKNHSLATNLIGAASSTVLNVSDSTGFATGQTILVTDYTTSTPTDTIAVIKSVNGNVITVNKTVSAPDKSTVRVATYFRDALQNIDDDGVATTASPTPLPEYQSTQSSSTDTAAGVQINSATVLDGNVKLAVTGTKITNLDTFNVAGRIVKTATASATIADATDLIDRSFPDSTMLSNGSTLTGVQKLVRAADNRNPAVSSLSTAQEVPPVNFNAAVSRYREMTQFADVTNGSLYGYGPGLYVNNKDDIEKIYDGTRYVALNSPQLHRMWQRKSFTITGVTTGNIVYTGAAGAIATGTDAFRLSFPRPGTDTYAYPQSTGSLEQRGIRGWISPWEYLPRGISIELKGSKIVVTRDARSDTDGGVPDVLKSWRDISGANLTSNLNDRAYQMTLDISGATSTTRDFGSGVTVTSPGAFNGVIFADGNVRVRGYISPSLKKSITIVSLGNIYVEGSLRQTDPVSGLRGGRIALIAKKNVVLNPSQFMPRADGVVDTDTAATGLTLTTNSSAGATTISVNNANRLKVGDRIRLVATNSFHTVTQISAVGVGPTYSATVTLDTAITTPITIATDSTLVQLVSLPPLVNGSTLAATNKTNEWFRQITTNSNVLLRSIKLDGVIPSTSYYLAGQMVGDRKDAFTVAPIYTIAAQLSRMGIKRDGDPDNITPVANNGIVSESEKKFEALAATSITARAKFSYDLDQLPASAGLTSVTRGNDSQNSIEYLEKWFMNSSFKSDLTYGSSSKYGDWSLTSVTSDKSTIAARYIAALGHKNGYYNDVDNDEDDMRVTTNLTALLPTNSTYKDTYTSYPVPLSTSVGLFWNIGAAVNLSSAPNFLIGSGKSYSDSENPDYVNETFYQSVTHTNSGLGTESFVPYANQALLRGVSVPLAGATGSDLINVALRPNFAGNPNLPGLRIGALKYETNNWATVGSYSAPTITIEASIIASEGSWFVIPMPLNTAFDIDGDGNGIPNEQQDYVTGTRFRRLNYQINVRGSIAQAFSPTGAEDYDVEPDPDGQALGAVSKWLDTSSYPTNIVAAPSATTYGGYAGKGTSWKTINYSSDPLVPDTKLYLPSSSELRFVN